MLSRIIIILLLLLITIILTPSSQYNVCDAVNRENSHHQIVIIKRVSVCLTPFHFCGSGKHIFMHIESISLSFQLLKLNVLWHVSVVDHDDSPNSPPSAVSSQGSSVDISLARDVSFVQLLYNYTWCRVYSTYFQFQHHWLIFYIYCELLV